MRSVFLCVWHISWYILYVDIEKKGCNITVLVNSLFCIFFVHVIMLHLFDHLFINLLCVYLFAVWGNDQQVFNTCLLVQCKWFFHISSPSLSCCKTYSQATVISLCFFTQPFNSQTKFVILLTVNHMILIMVV